MLQEEQTVRGRSYTDFTQQNFDCGRYKSLSEIRKEEGSGEAEDDLRLEKRSISSTDEEEQLKIFGFDFETTEGIICGATIISDR